MNRLPSALPEKIVFLKALGQLWGLRLKFFGNLQPMTARGNSLHAVLVERVGYDIGSRNQIACIQQKTLDAARRVKAEIVAVRAAKYLVDFRLKSNVN